MKTFKLIHILKTSPSLRLLRILFSLLTQLSFAGADTTIVAKQQFPLHDPRNPDCPCHKIQKQAEEEFAQQNKRSDQLHGNNGENKVNEWGQNTSNLFFKTKRKPNQTISSLSFTKYKRKKKSLWLTKIKFKIRLRMHSIKKTVPDYEICFKW